ncbi:MAG TPA: alpha/beta fold hydrolase, partial [Desulfuromonadales bacterium]|nr:alpha/beta fold hydrolase [Desulfuromonadales bacterium]
MFEGFRREKIGVNNVEINLVVGGNGPPLLLLHGYPQTHLIWRKVAPRLAQRFTVVASDLRG